MGGYDLYGNWYPRTCDAINAEMAQCADIDSRHHQQEQQQTDSELHRLYDLIHSLELRIKKLEKVKGVE